MKPAAPKGRFTRAAPIGLETSAPPQRGDVGLTLFGTHPARGQPHNDARLGGSTPSPMNTDQGAEFCSDEWVGVVQQNGVLDNVMVEQLWPTVNWDHLYLHDYSSVRAARAGLGEFFP